MKEYVLVKEMFIKCYLKLIIIKFVKMFDLKRKKDIFFFLIYVFSIFVRLVDV